jgi:hypothetical protein
MCRLCLEKNRAKNQDLNQTRTLVQVLIMSQRAVLHQSPPPDQARVQVLVLIGK